jgi:hypothetical protein
MTALDRVTSALESHGLTCKHTSRDTAMALCPCHNDKTPSLSLRQSRGRALVYCHAGCQTTDVLMALGLTPPDLFDNPKGVEYRYSDGRVVHRRPDKSFYQTGDKTRAVLYIPPKLDLVAALQRGDPIFLPEGEQDVDTLASLEVAAVTSPMGAQHWAKCDYTPLTGARNLIIIQDRDEQGRQRANGLYHHLRSLGAEVVIVEAAVGKDVTDHIMAGCGLEQLVPVMLPEIGSPAVDGRFDPIFDSSMMPVLPMEWAWKDMVPLGGLTLLVGTGGIGKTSFATYLIAQLQRGVLEGHLEGVHGTSIWIGNEDSWQRTILPRFIVNGGDRRPETFSRMRMPQIMHEEHGESPSLPEHLGIIRRAIEMTGCKLILIDPIIALLSPALNADKAADVRRAMQPLNALAEEMNVTILGVHHLNKNTALSASSRLSGSHAWRDVARATITFAMDEDAGMVILSNTKNNVGIDGRSFAYRKKRILMEIDGVPFDIPQVDWVGEVQRTADDVMNDEAVLGRGGELKRELVDYILHAGHLVDIKAILEEMIDERMVASSPANVKMTLGRLVKAGVVARVDRGRYGPPDSKVSGMSPQSNTPRASSKIVTSVTTSGEVTEVTGNGHSREVVTFCHVCSFPLPDRLIAEGETVHPTCG